MNIMYLVLVRDTLVDFFKLNILLLVIEAHFCPKNVLGDGGGGVSKIVSTRQKMSLNYFATIPYIAYNEAF